MIHSIYPCLWFDGNAKEAAEFYCSAFNNSKIIASNPIVSVAEICGKKFMCLNGGPMFKMNPSISAFVISPSLEETNKLWGKLMDGGKALMPIDAYPWSERYGWLQDKFGFTWQISFDSKTPKQKITLSMLFTQKQFGKAEEAIKLYCSLFKNTSIENMILYPKEDANAGKVMFSEFKLNDQLMIAMDGPGDHKYTFDEGVSLAIECDTQQEIDHYWNGFTKEGEESMCGWCKDKFGVSWQVVPSMLGSLMSDPVKGPRVIQAFMKMKKFDIETLKNA